MIVEIYIVLYGEAANPERSDDIIGYAYTEAEANDFCNKMNMTASKGYAYWSEPAKKLPK